MRMLTEKSVMPSSYFDRNASDNRSRYGFG